MRKSIPQKAVCHSYYLVFGLVGYGMLPPLNRRIELAWDMSHSRLGVLLGVGSVLYGIASIVAGISYDRFGARLVMTIAMAVAAAGAGCMAGAPTVWAFTAALMVFLIGNGATQVVNPLAGALYGRHRGRGLNVLHAFQSIGRLLAPLLVVACVAIFGQWQVILLVSTGLFATWTLLCATVLRGPGMPPTSSDGDAFNLRGALQFLRDRRILLALACFVVVCIGEGIAIFWTANFLETERGLSRDMSLYCLSAMMGGATVVRLAIGLLPRFPAGPRFIAATAVVAAPAYVLLVSTAQPVLLLGVCVVLGMATGAYWPVLAAAVLNHTPRGHGALIGLCTLTSCLAGLAGHALAGILGDSVGLWAALVLSAICALLFAAGYWWFLTITRHPAIAEAERR